MVRIVLAGLTKGGHLITRAPVPRARDADRAFLEEVLHGLQTKFG